MLKRVIIIAVLQFNVTNTNNLAAMADLKKKQFERNVFDLDLRVQLLW